VKLSDWPESMATWEDVTDLKRRFPRAPAWGQVGSQGWEYVSSSVPNGPITSEDDAPVTSDEPDREQVRDPSHYTKRALKGGSMLAPLYLMHLLLLMIMHLLLLMNLVKSKFVAHHTTPN
jgi:hypothetical protein